VVPARPEHTNVETRFRLQRAEREELARLWRRCKRSPRLSRLLRYLGEKYFQAEIDHFTNTTLPPKFLAAPDGLRRWRDALRGLSPSLRKKLKEFYDTEGKNRSIQLSIPSGTYSLSTRAQMRRLSGAKMEPANGFRQNGDFSGSFEPGRRQIT